MFNSLKSKLIVPIICILLLMIVVIIVYVSVAASNLGGELAEQRVDLASGVVAARLADFEDKSRLTAMNIANDGVLVSNLLRWNDGQDMPETRQELMRFLNEMRVTFNVSSFMLVDGNGDVVLRTHVPDNYGDSVLGNRHVASALQGNPTSVYISVAGVPVGITSVIPIRYDGNILGTLSANVNMATEDFVDEFAYIFDARVMIFQGDTIVMASAAAGGNRAADITLLDGVTGVAEMVIGGEPFHVYHHPLLGADGNAVGTLLLAFSNQVAADAVLRLQIILIVIGLAALLGASGMMLFIIVRLLKPLEPLAQTITNVASGNFNVNINRSNIKNDEIGRITRDVGSLIDVTKGIVDDLAKFAYENKVVGDIEYRIDPNKYQGGYKEMILSLNEQVDDFTDGVIMLLGAIGNINKGNFRTELRTQPGKKIILNQTAEALMANLAGVRAEIAGMVDAAANKGDLSFKIDEAKYEGDWREIMVGLNSISEAVDVPLRAINVALREMKSGYFDMGRLLQKIGEEGLPTDPAKYVGVFGDIVMAVNATMAEISSYITEISENLSAMSGGDFTRSINRDFVGSFALIKTSLNNITETLNKTMADISGAASQVLAGSKQISTSAMNLANGATAQASSVQELNASVDLINQQTRQNAENAAAANELSNKSTSNAQKGNEAMKQLLEAMQGIKEASASISSIIKTIQDIAFQTNLLSLNASVEAARAGEHGRGFSVVADEVRNLATRSQESATDTTRLIGDSISRVESGSSIATATAESLDAIVASANEVLSIITGISDASKDQAEAIQQVSEGIGQISAIVQSNSALSEETAAASQELNSQADLLQQLVAYFKLRR